MPVSNAISEAIDTEEASDDLTSELFNRYGQDAVNAYASEVFNRMIDTLESFNVPVSADLQDGTWIAERLETQFSKAKESGEFPESLETPPFVPDYFVFAKIGSEAWEARENEALKDAVMSAVPPEGAVAVLNILDRETASGDDLLKLGELLVRAKSARE